MGLSSWCVLVGSYHPHFSSSTHSQGPTVRSRVQEGDRNTRDPLTCTKEGMLSVTLAINMNLLGKVEKGTPNTCPCFFLVPTVTDSVSLSGTWPFLRVYKFPCN